MLYKPSAVFVLLSALSHYYVSGAVVSLLVPLADGDEAVTGQFLGTDAAGHTSWSLGPGVPSGAFTNTDFAAVTLVADATDVHEVGALSTVLQGVTVTLTASAGCAVATGANGSPVSAVCSGSAEAVGAFSGTSTTNVVATTFTSLPPMIAVHVADSGSGAVPTAVSTSGSGTATTSAGGSASTSGAGSAPASTSTKNAAAKERLGWGVVGAAGLLLAGLV
ncbi:hypothetical protein GSI_11822 [Ganoderma sinense ZZ0214-1]|uniref:Uncharacterized protein n=1 Tax=Ganoderma sinense ZZ0214-1 TaxID=1077348 RepID=A0A2G8RXM5_9APHY|nr:hypothetical protein GSI_11822 [Ganoderma sinense ZZ0214-1]